MKKLGLTLGEEEDEVFEKDKSFQEDKTADFQLDDLITQEINLPIDDIENPFSRIRPTGIIKKLDTFFVESPPDLKEVGVKLIEDSVKCEVLASINDGEQDDQKLDKAGIEEYELELVNSTLLWTAIKRSSFDNSVGNEFNFDISEDKIAWLFSKTVDNLRLKEKLIDSLIKECSFEGGKRLKCVNSDYYYAYFEDGFYYFFRENGNCPVKVFRYSFDELFEIVKAKTK